MSTPWETDTDKVRLRIGKCRVCRHTYFPPQAYGCERCGATGSDLTTVTVPATGVITASVDVHTHPVYPTPFTIGEIALDHEPVVVQALLGSPQRVGDRVVGAAAESGSGVLFTPEEVSVR